MSGSKLTDFIDYLNEQVSNHSIYTWGAQGQGYGTVTEAWIRGRESKTGSYSDGTSYADAAVAYWKKQCLAGFQTVLKAFDCSGLGIYWLYNLKHLFSGDMTADDMMGKCARIDFSDRKKGCWLFRVNSAGDATHIGYMVNDTNVVHAKGRKYGVVKEKAKSSYWHRCGIPEIFASEIDAGDTAADTGDTSTDSASDENLAVVGQIVVDGIKEWCNVRSGPGLENSKIGKAYVNEVFDVYGIEEEWYKIDFHGVVGFIYYELVSEKLEGN